MVTFETKKLPLDPDIVAPDGSNVRILLGLKGASIAHFELAPGLVSIAVAHSTVEEVWYFLSGAGEMWRREGEYVEVVRVEPGLCISIPCGTAFQFRSEGPQALTAVAATAPPWPGQGEAYAVDGPWKPKLEAP